MTGQEELVARVAILEAALERLSGMESVPPDIRAHCDTALRRSRQIGPTRLTAGIHHEREPYVTKEDL